MKSQNLTNIHPASIKPASTLKEYGIPVTPYLADQERLDRLGKVLEGLHKGEFKRPAVLSRALDALEKELIQPTKAT